MTGIKVAVTGASGFLGRYVVRQFIQRGVDVVAASREIPRIAEFAKSCSLIELDIGSISSDFYAKLGRPHALVHLAWDGLPNYGSAHHFEVELPKQYKFLKALLAQGLPSLIVTGTCLEYGLQSGALRADAPTNPCTAYGIAKDTLRRQLQLLAHSTNFRLTWTRLFYMFGEGQAPGSLYPSLKQAVSRGDKTFNMSSGEQLRDYLPVSEVARQLADLTLSADPSGVVNICSGKPISVRRLAEQWIAQEKWDIALNLGHYAAPKYEPFAFWGVPAARAAASSS